MEETIVDDIGRCFCKKHRREICHDCCMDFEPMNRNAEEDAGLRKKRTDVELAAEEKATALFALKGMERMNPRPNLQIFEENREWLQKAEDKLQALAAEGKDIDEPVRKAIEKERNREIQQQALMQAWAKQNPGKSTFEFGGPETQELFDKIAATPSMSHKRSETSTCDYCKKTSMVKLDVCSRCKVIAYCNRDCQKAAWKAHKKICIPWQGKKDPKDLPLTWDEVEAHDGVPVTGKTLEVRAMLDESMMRQVFSCKDRAGNVRRIAAYTNSRRIPGLQQGSILKWKNPRFHYFMDGSSGARIEEEDLVNITVV